MPTAIAKRIKDIRRYLGPWPRKLLPREQIAEALGVDPSTVKRWEAGSVPEPENLAKLAAFAGCDLDWLLTGHGRPPERGAAKRQRGALASEPQEGAPVHPIRDRPSSGLPDAPAHSVHPGNTPVMTTSGEEPISGSPGPDEVGMALAILQRAFTAALQPGVDTQARREWLYWTLVGFAGQLGQQQFQDVAQALTQVAEVLRNGGISG